MRRKPGTDTKFPAQFAGNWLSVPGFAPRDRKHAPATKSPFEGHSAAEIRHGDISLMWFASGYADNALGMDDNQPGTAFRLSHIPGSDQKSNGAESREQPCGLGVRMN